MVLTGLALVLRIYRLDHQSLWGDELFSAQLTSLPFGAMVQRLIQDFVHPPLHYLVLWALYWVTEPGSLEGRLLSALFGTAAVPVMYLVGRRFFGLRCGLIAAALMAVSQLGVMYSQELRMYSMQMFFVSLALLFFHTAASERKPWAWWAFVITSTLGIYTHYYSVFFVAPLLALAVVDRRHFPLSRVLAGVASIGLLFLPWLASGVVEAALSSPKTAPAAQPGWFSVTWTTPFESLNQYNNGGLANVFGGGQPPIAHWLGAILIWTPAVASLGLLGRKSLEGEGGVAVWGIAAVATLAFSGAAGGATAGLALAAVIALRAVQLGARAWLPEGSWMSVATSDHSWGGVLLAAGGVAAWIQAPAWVLFVLGSLLGGILCNHLLEPSESSRARKPGEVTWIGARAALVLAWVVPFAVPLLAGLESVQYDVRYTLAGLPAYLVLAAHGFSLLQPARMRLLALGACGVFSALALRANYFVPYKENWRDAMAVVADRYVEGDCVAVIPWGAGTVMPPAWSVYGYASRHPDLDTYPVGDLDTAAAECGRLWTIGYRRIREASAAADSIEEILGASHRQSERHEFFWTDVLLHERLRP